MPSVISSPYIGLPELVVAGTCSKAQNHTVVIPQHLWPTADWLDVCCWRCGTDDAVEASDGRVVCAPCRVELRAQPSTDAVALARHSYWERHALRCCWRCMTGAVDPGDDIGLCRSCLEFIGGPARGTMGGPGADAGAAHLD